MCREVLPPVDHTECHSRRGDILAFIGVSILPGKGKEGGESLEKKGTTLIWTRFCRRPDSAQERTDRVLGIVFHTSPAYRTF
jgi:hypothetical protein